MLRPFHLAFPVKNLETTRKFYSEVLQCKVGRSAQTWIDFDFFGHQISAHLVASDHQRAGDNPVDGDQIPIPHFGVVLEPDQLNALALRLKKLDVVFLIEPKTRFAGQPGEQTTMFLSDPSGNVIEFKSFADDENLFATN
jgi:hypothetical protein